MLDRATVFAGRQKSTGKSGANQSTPWSSCITHTQSPASEKGHLVRGIKGLDRVIPSKGFALNNKQNILLKVATA